MKSYRKAKKAAMQAASIQWACKIKGYPRNSNEMSKMFVMIYKTFCYDNDKKVTP